MKRVVRKITEHQLKEQMLLYKRLASSSQKSGHKQQAAWCLRKYQTYRELLTREWGRGEYAGRSA